MTIFLDNNMPPALADLPVRCRIPATHVLRELGADVDDPVWIRHASSLGMMAVTRDKHITTRPVERAALLSTGLRVAILVFDDGPRLREIIGQFLIWLPEIQARVNDGHTVLRLDLRHEGRHCLARPDGHTSWKTLTTSYRMR
jgi:predicted nuclease of predicted toxin-antitoxin system